MAVTTEQVLAALKDLKDPSSGRPLSELGYLKHPEILPGSGVLAAAEPVRRGGGSAMVENPTP